MCLVFFIVRRKVVPDKKYGVSVDFSWCVACASAIVSDCVVAVVTKRCATGDCDIDFYAARWWESIDCESVFDR